MMKVLTVFIGFIILVLPTVLVYASPPPSTDNYPSGWGMNPTVWERRGSSFSEWGIYDPVSSGAGGFGQGAYGWRITDKPPYKPRAERCLIPYQALRTMSGAPVTLELWIESYLLFSYENTCYQWHRLGDAGETITFVIEGTTQSNTELEVVLIPESEALTHIEFVEDIWGRTGSEYGSDLEISWRGRWGNGLECGESIQWGWETLIPDAETGSLGISNIPPCDHWFQFEGSFMIPYHQPDGYYKLVINGCPVLII